jgi:hypothetical protein
MKKLGLLLLPILLGGCLNLNINNLNQNKFEDKTIIATCCSDKENPKITNASLCEDTFQDKCEEKNGVVVLYDYHPSGGFCKECRTKSSDTSKACANNSDCNYYCDYEESIRLGNCTETNKEKAGYSYGDLYSYTYKCSDPVKPGVCSAAKSGLSNPGGKDVSYKIENGYLYKLEIPGVIE